MNQPEDYPRENHGREYLCPHCNSADWHGPTPAMMEDDDWRIVCRSCLRRSTYPDARVAWLRQYSAQREMTRTIPT